MEEAKVEKVEVADVADKMVMVERSETDDLLCFILDLLKSPEEHQRRLEEIPEIHADPHMDPNYASEEDEGDPVENNMRPGGSSFSREGLEPVSPRKGGFTCNDSWTLMKNYLSMS